MRRKTRPIRFNFSILCCHFRCSQNVIIDNSEKKPTREILVKRKSPRWCFSRSDFLLPNAVFNFCFRFVSFSAQLNEADKYFIVRLSEKRNNLVEREDCRRLFVTYRVKTEKKRIERVRVFSGSFKFEFHLSKYWHKFFETQRIWKLTAKAFSFEQQTRSCDHFLIENLKKWKRKTRKRRTICNEAK